MACGCSGESKMGSGKGPSAYSRHNTSTHAWSSAQTKRGRAVQMNAKDSSDSKLTHHIQLKPSMIRGR